MKYGFEALHYELASPHGMISTWGGQAPPVDMSMVKPMDQVLRSGLFGPWDKPEVIANLDALPPGVNPKKVKQWGVDSWHFYPNFMLLIWEPGWFLTYHYWPTAVDKHIFECTLYFVPPRNARERLAQELAAVTFKEYALQDANTLEATQTMIGTKVVNDFRCATRNPAPPSAQGDRRLRSRLREGEPEQWQSYRLNSPTWNRISAGTWPPSPSVTPSAWPPRWVRCKSSTTLPSRT